MATPAAPAALAAAGQENRNIRLGVRLAPVDDFDLPVVANYTAINVSPGMAFIDFGFIKPGMLAALPRMVQQGSKLPENINCKLAVRVAMGYEALSNLQQQLTQVLEGLKANAAKK
ncbi:MAG: hypothetical protein FJY55_12470 [Betaproteobacteria bacterium]|nr:hypothetical protein [Betaproteobacteria bacterium]